MRFYLYFYLFFLPETEDILTFMMISLTKEITTYFSVLAKD